MTRILAGLVLAGWAATAQAQPRIAFPGSPWDFGEMLQQQKAMHRFEVRNEGVDTLFISRVKPECGCTSAPLTKDVIAPGESIWLDITFNSRRFSGNVTKHVVVYSNDPEQAEARLTFSARVETQRLTLAPLSEPADLGDLLPDRGNQAQIALANVGNEPYRLTLADWPQGWLEPSWTERVVDPGDTLILLVGTRGMPPLGRFEESLTFEVEGRARTRVSMPITGMGLVE